MRWEPEVPASLPVPMPTVEIKFPIAEQWITSQRAPAYVVRLKVERWPLGTSGRGVVLALDDFTPRRVTGLEQRLGDLLPSDSTLSAGAHRLVAVAVDDHGIGVNRPRPGGRRPFGVVRFYVGQRGTVEPERNGLILLSPAGKLITDDARLLVDYYVFGSSLGREFGPVHFNLVGPDGEWHTEARTPLWLSGLGPGRYHLQAELEGDPSAHAERTFELERALTREVPP